MVEAVAEQHRPRVLQRGLQRQRFLDALFGEAELRRVAIEPPEDARMPERRGRKVAEPLVHSGHCRSVRCLPVEDGAVFVFDGLTHSPHEDERVKAEPAEELGQLRRVAKRVGNVADVHRPAEPLAHAEATLQIADRGLAGR